ncbi:hypothetical protein [Lysobacter capsici]|uniref:hypothetical protein n=1 Tax=Lysobacter capsici TaxID=435897 RepID=UPI001C002BCB|nr:hypothetical protein [Lysobacter capsici]QWF19420.1 hypothetical protein KME82_12100 [Lysobacter capsici]
MMIVSGSVRPSLRTAARALRAGRTLAPSRRANRAALRHADAPHARDDVRRTMKKSERGHRSDDSITKHARPPSQPRSRDDDAIHANSARLNRFGKLRALIDAKIRPLASDLQQCTMHATGRWFTADRIQ